MKHKIGATIAILSVIIFPSMAKTGGDKDSATWNMEQLWTARYGEITEEKLLESLRAGEDRQSLKNKKTVEETIAAYRRGEISKEKLRQMGENMPRPIGERSCALTIISGNKFQSEAIDQTVMEVYGNSMNNQTVRLRCIEVMLNNAPEQSLQMLREYIADEERIDLDFRLIGVSAMLDQSHVFGHELIALGLASSNRNTRSLAESTQRKLDRIQSPGYESPPLVKTVAPPRGTPPETNTACQVSTPAANPAAANAGEQLMEQPKTTPSAPWKLALPILGILAIAATLLSRRKRA